MRKLFKLRQWLTLDEAASRLAITFDEAVSVADLLRLALDGQLKISLHLVNHARGRMGEIVGWEEVTLRMMPTIDGQLGPVPYVVETAIGDGRFIKIFGGATTITGVWDLAMFGAEVLDIEHQYQLLTGGPEVTLTNLEGVFLVGEENVVCQLLDHFEENEYEPGSQAAGAVLEQQIQEDDLSEADAEVMRQAYKYSRAKFLEKIKKHPDHAYYPLGGLPEDAVLVVRAAELRRLEEIANEDERTPATVSQPLKASSDNDNLPPKTAATFFKEYRAMAETIAKLANRKAISPSELATAVIDECEKAGYSMPVEQRTVKARIEKA